MMNIYGRTDRLRVRVIAALLIAAFVHQDLVWAQAGSPVWTVHENASEADKGPAPLAAVKRPAIPRSIGTVRHSGAAGAETVINIQDAHASTGAQESISKILETLVDEYDLRMVAVEGSSGYIDTSLMRTFPDADVKKEAASNLVKEGRMSAAELFAVTSSKPIAIYGVEDDPLYKENVEQFASVCEAGARAGRDIDALVSVLGRIKEKAFSPALKKLDGLSGSGADSATALGERLDADRAMAAEFGVEAVRYPIIEEIASILGSESAIDFAGANRERGLLIDHLTKTLPKDGLEGLVANSIAFKDGRVSKGQYHRYLLQKAGSSGVDASVYRNLASYADYVNRYESIDLAELFGQIGSFEDAIREKAFADDDQRELYRMSKCASLLKGMLDLKAMGAEYAYLKANMGLCDGARMADFVRRMGSKYGVGSVRMFDPEKITLAAAKAMEFYRTAERRNSALVENTIMRMRQEGVGVSALVTGGFHAAGISDLLRQRNASYFVILPKFDASKPERPYAAILTKKTSRYGRLLSSGGYHLATSAYFYADPSVPERERLAIYAADFRKMLESVAGPQADAALRRSKIAGAVAVWEENYGEFYEAFMAERLSREKSGRTRLDFTPKTPEEVGRFLRSLIKPGTEEPALNKPSAGDREAPQPAPKRHIAIVTANYNNAHHTEAFLKSLEGSLHTDYEVIIVDDGSKEPFKYDAAKYRLHGPVTVIQNNKNEGVSKARNIGLSYALSRGCDYVYFADNDTFLGPDTLSELELEAAGRPGAGIVGAQEFYYSRPDTFYSAGGSRILWLPRGHDEKDRGQYGEYKEVRALGTAAMLVKREVFEKIGGFDDYLYFGFEDVEFCLRAARAGFKIGACPHAKVLHNVGGGIPRYSAKRAYYLARNPLLMARRFGGMLRLELALRAFLVSARSFYGIVRSADLRALGGIWRGLVDGLFDGKFKAGKRKMPFPDLKSPGIAVSVFRPSCADAPVGALSAAVAGAKNSTDDEIANIIGRIEASSDISNDDLIESLARDKQALASLAQSLIKLATSALNATIKARAHLMIARLNSEERYLGVNRRIERIHTDMAMRAIRQAVERSIQLPTGRLRIPQQFFDSELVVECPLRVDLCHGGASDLFAVSYERGGRAVNIAVNLDGEAPVRVRVRAIPEKVIRIRSKDLEIENVIRCTDDILGSSHRGDPLRLIKAAFVVSGIINPMDERFFAKVLEEMGGGIEIETYSGVPKGSGLGTSSILGVAVLYALYRVSGQNKTREELVDAGLYLEQMLGIGGGWQDPLGGIYPGIKVIESAPLKPTPRSREITMPEDAIRRLEERMVLFNTGSTHFAGDLLKKLTIDFLTRSPKEYRSRERLVAMDDDMIRSLEAGDIDRVGALLKDFWREWRALNPGASDPRIDDIFNSVSDITAGAKLCGAGGGGLALFIAKEGKRSELEARLRNLGDWTEGAVYAATVNRTGLTEKFRAVTSSGKPSSSDASGASAGLLFREEGLDAKYADFYSQFQRLSPRADGILSKSALQKMAGAFETLPSGEYKRDGARRLIPVRCDTYAALIGPEVLGPATARILDRLRDETERVLPSGVERYRTDAPNYHINISVFQDVVPGVNEGTRMSKAELDRLYSAFGEAVEAVLSGGAFRLRLEGIRIMPDGSVIAVWKDSGQIRSIREEFYARAVSAVGEEKVASVRPKTIIHTTLLRILSDIDPNTLKELKRISAVYKDMSDEDITVSVDSIRVIHERQWLLPEKHETLGRLELVPAPGTAQSSAREGVRKNRELYARRYLKYPNPRSRSLELDAYDRAHYYWDQGSRYWRSRDNPRLVLGTCRDIRRPSRQDAVPTSMENHVAIRMRAGYTIYIFDSHSASPKYLEEACERGEIRRHGNAQIFIDDHPDTTRDADPDSRTASDIAAGGWLASHHWVYFDDMWGRGKSILGPSAPISGLGVTNDGCHSSRYFDVGSRPREKRAIFNIDTDATGDLRTVMEFVKAVHENDGIVPSSVHISTSPPNTDEPAGRYPNDFDGLFYPEGFGSVDRCASLARERALPSMLESGAQPVVIGLPRAAGAKDISLVRAALAELAASGAHYVIETYEDGAEGFNAALGKSGSRGIYIDESFFSSPGVRPANLSEFARALGAETAAVVLGTGDRDEIGLYMDRLRALLPAAEKVDPDGDYAGALASARAALQEASGRRRSRVRSACACTGAYEPAVLAVARRGPVAIGLTERFVRYDLFSADQMEEAIKASEVMPFFVYNIGADDGASGASTEPEAKERLRLYGYSDAAIARMRFIDGSSKDFGEISSQMARSAGVGESGIGIGALEGELSRGPREAGFLLEAPVVNVGGRSFYTSMNGIAALLNLMAKFDPATGETGADGVMYDTLRKVFRYVPRAVPLDYQAELEIYRRAVKLIRSSA
jgi:GT2 family glycosyltransferase/galactokinase/mevalonate kinase-like predicted kinase